MNFFQSPGVNMIGGTENLINRLEKENSLNPSESLQQALELLRQLDTLSRQDRNTYLRIDELASQLKFDQGSSSTGRSEIAISIEKMRNLLRELTVSEKRRKPVRFAEIQ